MGKTKNKNIALAVLSVFCGAAIVGGIGAGSAKGLAKAEESALYSADFESLSVEATANEIYGSTGWAGVGNNYSIVESTPSYIEALYQFYDNGCQISNMYQDSNRGVPSSAVGKTYRHSLKFQVFGEYSDMTLMVTGPSSEYNSVIVVKPDSNVPQVANYGGEFITLAESSKSADGWWTIEYDAAGTGGYIMGSFAMNVPKDKVAEINAAKNTGVRLAKYDVTEGENVMYSLNVTPGLSGDGVYQATGFAGGSEISTKEGKGITGKTLKANYSFWSTAEGGWQKEALYINENSANVYMKDEEQYKVEFEIAPFGRVDQTICIFNQVGAAGIDSQIILKSDGTYDSAEYGATKIFDSYGVTRIGNRFKVTAVLNGKGGMFKIMVNMHSSDADGANEAKDTGLYFDNFTISKQESVKPDVPADYKTMYSQNFNAVSLDISGSDAMYHATGFAGVGTGSLTIAENGVEDTRCLKAVYDFYDNGYQRSNLYLDSGKTSGVSPDGVYRFRMQLKPFGHWDKLNIGFCPSDNIKDFVVLHKDGTLTLERAASGSILIDASCEEEGGVYTITATMNGSTNGYIFNLFHMFTTDVASANANETGFYLDNYTFAIRKEAEPMGFNKKAAFYNKAIDGDFRTAATFEDIAKVTIGSTELTDGQYTLENGIFTVKASALKALENGAVVLRAENANGDSAEIALEIGDAAVGTVYETDFSAMPVLSGDQEAKDKFYQNSYMDPGAQNVFTADEGEDRKIKFVPTGDVSESYNDMFQFNPREGRLNMLSKDKWHTVSMDWKPENASMLLIKGHIWSSTVTPSLFRLELDVKNGKRVDNGEQSPEVSWSIEEKEDGWYRVRISFFYGGDGYPDDSAAYVVFGSAKEAEGSFWLLDNIEVCSEMYPSYVDGKTEYDLASGNTPYFLVDLCKSFSLISLKIGDVALTENTDYTLSETPVGHTRIDLTKEFCKKYGLGDEETIIAATTKGTEIPLSFHVVDTSPVLPEEPIGFDKAERKDVAFGIDLSGYEISTIFFGETELIGTEFYIDTQGRLVFKYEYLKDVALGKLEFKLVSTSGASGKFTIAVSDTSPAFGTVSGYDKSKGGAYAVELDVKGREIVSVVFGNKTLTAEEYAYKDGTLTVAASVMNGFIVGEYDLTVTTIVSVTAKVNVIDLPPVVTGEYTVKRGNNLVIELDTHEKPIVSVTVDGLTLRAGEYVYADGKLTIGSAIFDEIAVGERTCVIVTEGGIAELTFILQEGAGTGSETSADTGCGSSVTGTMSVVGLGAAVALLLKKKRK